MHKIHKNGPVVHSDEDDGYWTVGDDVVRGAAEEVVTFYSFSAVAHDDEAGIGNSTDIGGKENPRWPIGSRALKASGSFSAARPT